MTAGWTTTVWIPGTARDVELRGEADTGIVWNRWQEIGNLHGRRHQADRQAVRSQRLRMLAGFHSIYQDAHSWTSVITFVAEWGRRPAEARRQCEAR